MQSSSRRRLPSLHSIGRSRCVDLEELPSEPAWLSDDEDDEQQLASSDSTRPPVQMSRGRSRPVTEQSKFDAFRSSTGNEAKNYSTASGADGRGEFPASVGAVNLSDDDDEATQPDVSAEDDIMESVADSADIASQALRRHFRVATDVIGLQYLCPRVVAAAACEGNDAAGGCRFRHSTCSVQLASGLRDVDGLLTYRARLMFVRQVLQQIRLATTFVGELRQLFDAECRTWHGIVRNDTDGRPPSSCLEQLHLLVDELRVHLGRWSAVRRQLMDFRRLSRRLCRNPKYRQLQMSLSPNSSWQQTDSVAAIEDSAWLRLSDLGEAAIAWTSRLVGVGFRVLAHCDLERVSQDTLWNVARGLEQFNGLLSSADWCGRRSGSTSSLPSSWRRLPSEPVSMSTVLQMIANERSKYAAASVREHFVGNRDFVRLLMRRRLPPPLWLRRVDRDDVQSVTVQTSDYASGNSRSDATLRDIATSNDECCGIDHALMLVPDLRGYPSPLVDFNRRESTFAARFLEVICRSTDMIRFAADQAGSVQSRPVSTRADATTGGGSSNGGGRGEESTSDVAALSDGESWSSSAADKFESVRKCVSWGDASLAVAAKQTMKFYVNAIWCRFASHLYDFLVTMDWLSSRERRNSKDHFDSILLCPDTATLILHSMIRQASSDGVCYRNDMKD